MYRGGVPGAENSDRVGPRHKSVYRGTLGCLNFAVYTSVNRDRAELTRICKVVYRSTTCVCQVSCFICGGGCLLR